MAKMQNNRIWQECKDVLTGAAFPLMIQIIFSTSLILFADMSGELALQVVALVFGEVLLIGAYIIFGRQNGISDYRRTVINNKKRAITNDESVSPVGEYALWKAFVIGLVSVIPYMFFQFIQCLAPNTFFDFILKYGFGWAVYPFIVIGEHTGELSPWLNFIWVVVPVGVHAGAYVFGAYREKVKQAKIAEAGEDKRKR